MRRMRSHLGFQLQVEPAMVPSMKVRSQDVANHENNQSAETVEPKMVSGDNDAKQGQHRVQK